MAAITDLGVRIVGVQRNDKGIEFKFDTNELETTLDRLTAAVRELDSAWKSLPVGVRRAYGGVTITLHAEAEEV